MTQIRAVKKIRRMRLIMAWVVYNVYYSKVGKPISEQNTSCLHRGKDQGLLRSIADSSSFPPLGPSIVQTYVTPHMGLETLHEG